MNMVSTQMSELEICQFNKANPYSATLLENYKLNKPGSIKDTRHIVFDLEESGITYTPGDSIYVYPENCRALVEELLGMIKLDLSYPEELDRFTRSFNITRPSNKLYALLVEKFSLHENAKDLAQKFEGMTIPSILKCYGQGEISSNELAENSASLSPRAYSIASSQVKHPTTVDLCVSRVEEEINGHKVFGTCSNYLASLVPHQSKSRIYIHKNDKFRLPEDLSQDIIMIGPGTGIAPFRAFIEERFYAMTHGRRVGRNWLFFGDQREKFDYLYGEEFQTYEQRGALKISTAFSRDQEYKVYVQNRMKENEDEIFEWIKGGAYFYVCGDARKMAKDVDTALREILTKHGVDADSYIDEMKAQGRYSRDIY